MGRYSKYFSYVFRHKLYVTIECFKKGLFFRGLLHDLSKFRPSEWFPYARFFYDKDGSKKTRRDKTGYYKPTDTGDDKFDFAWLLHQKRNDHHWQWWICPQEGRGYKTFAMSNKAIMEMHCDWIGAGRAQGIDNWDDVRPWYRINKDKMILHPDTRVRIEDLIKIV